MAGIAATLSPLGPHFGAELTDIDVRAIGRTVPRDAVVRTLHDRQLLCFRDQRLTPDELVAFTRLFGKPLPHVLQQFSLPGRPEIYVLSNIVEDGRPIGNRREGFGWHTDLGYMARPAALTILYGIEVPAEGADTLFASLYALWETVDETEKARWRTRRGLHSYIELYSRRTDVAPLTDEQKARTPDVRQPLVRSHPATGREGLYVGGDDCIAVEGGSDPAGDFADMRRLFETATERFAYRHRWRPGDLLVWDNRGLLHTATDYDTERHRRLIWRTSVLGEAPLASTAG